MIELIHTKSCLVFGRGNPFPTTNMLKELKAATDMEIHVLVGQIETIPDKGRHHGWRETLIIKAQSPNGQ